MRKPTLFALVAVIVLLLGATAVLYSKYRTTTASYTESKTRYGEAINEIASIQDSLNAIQLGDPSVRLLPDDLQAETRLSETRGDEALARIAVLKAGIERTKEKIEQLDASLRESGVQVVGLKKMIKNLKSTVGEKEKMVAYLSSRVDSLQTTVTGLVATVEQNQDTIQAQAQVIEDKRRELGTIFYAIGTKKDLTNSGVIEAKGGLLGIRKTLKPSGNFDESRFTAMDTDMETVVHIPAAKVQVLSAQPLSSYRLELVGNQMELHILDTKEFRKVKHLIIMTA